MGLYDRDYAREEPTGLRIGADWSAVVTIIVVCVGVSFVNLLSVSLPFHPVGLLNEHGALLADLFYKPWQAWQLLTYGWLHNNFSPGHLICNMLTLWAFGTHAEGLLFTKGRFYRFYISSLILAGLGWVCATYLFFNRQGGEVPAIPLIGASGGVAAVVCYSILCNPYRTMLLYFVEVPAWVVGVLMLSYDIWGSLGYGFGSVAYSAHIFGALAGLLFYKTGWCLADVIPWRWLGFQYQRLQRPGVKLHRPSLRDDDDEPADEEDLDEMKQRMDEILEKISRSGNDSLTKAERQFMEYASRRLREQKRR